MNQRQPLSPLAYAVIALIAGMIGIGLLFFYVCRFGLFY
jgi:hypothetical protein